MKDKQSGGCRGAGRLPRQPAVNAANCTDTPRAGGGGISRDITCNMDALVLFPEILWKIDTLMNGERLYSIILFNWKHGEGILCGLRNKRNMLTEFEPHFTNLEDAYKVCL